MSRRGWWVVAAVVGVWVLVLGGIAVVAIGAAGFLGGAGEFEEQTIKGEGDQKVVVIEVTGEIHTGESGPGDAGARDIIAMLEQAQTDDAVAAVILRIDTPGGGVVASDEIYRKVRRVSEDKPVVSSMAEIAASGGYYIASGSDRIVANPATITGSIGVIAVFPNLQGTADKLGVSTTIVKSGRFKDAGSPFREMSPEELELFQRLIDEAYDTFVEAVSQGRGMEEAEVRDVADGRVVSGTQAADLDLVDELGDLDRAYEVALELANLDRDASTLLRYERGTSLTDLVPGGPFLGVDEIRRELGIGFGLKYLFLP